MTKERDRFQIKVTKYEISRCEAEDNERCAIAMALYEKGHTRVEVELLYIKIGKTPFDCSWYVKWWQQRLIAGKKVPPITLIFDVDRAKVYRKLWKIGV